MSLRVLSIMFPAFVRIRADEEKPVETGREGARHPEVLTVISLLHRSSRKKQTEI